MLSIRTKLVFTKYLIFTTNFLFGIISILLILLGTEIVTSYNAFEVFLESTHFKPAFILFLIGIAMFVCSFVGCFGVMKQSVLIINVSAVLLLLLYFFENFLILYTYKKRWEIRDDVQSKMTDVMNHYNAFDYAKKSWNFLQEKFHCCGVMYPSDWAPINIEGCSLEENGLSFGVPLSCTNHTMECGNIYQKGCLTTIDNIFLKYYDIIAITILASTFMQLIKVFVAFAHVKTIRKYRRLVDARRQEEGQYLLPNEAESERLFI